MTISPKVPLYFLKEAGPLLEVEDIMSHPITITAQKTVAKAIQKMKEHHISCLVVVGKNQSAVGIITEKDILHKVIIYRKDPNKLKVDKIMTSPVITIPPKTIVFAAGRLMSRKKIRRLVVLENHRLKGIITQTDVAHVISCFGIWRDVRDVMNRKVVTVPYDSPVIKVARLMKGNVVSSIIVTKGKKAVGILTEKDFVRKIMSYRRDPTQKKVKDVMSSPIISVPPHFSVFNACRLMEKNKIRRLVVMEKGHLIGILTKTDIFRAFDTKLSMFEDEYFESLNRVPYGFFITDSDMRVKFANQAFLKIFAIDKMHNIIDKPLLPPPSWNHADERKACIDILTSKQVLKCNDITLRDSLGNIKHLAVYCISLKKIEEGVIGYQGIIIDMTEQKTAEEALIESKERFHTIFEESPVSLWLEDFSKVKKYFTDLKRRGVKDFRKYFEKNPKAVHKCAAIVEVLDVNKSTLELFKAKSKKEFLGSLGKIFARETYPTFKEELIALTEGKTRFETKTITQRLTGGRDDIILRLSVVSGCEKTLSKVVVSITDISERKKTEEALQKSEEQFRQFFDNEPEYCYMISPKGVILDMNKSALKVLGYKKEEIIGKPLKTIYAPELVPRMKQLFAKWKKTGKLRNEEIVIITKKGVRHTVLLSAGAVRDKEGKILHSVSVQKNITEHKKTEDEIKKRTEELERFHRMAVGRELKMIELKKRIKELESKK